MLRHLRASLLSISFVGVLVAMIVANGAPIASASAYASARQLHAHVALQGGKHSHAFNPQSCTYYEEDEAFPTVFGASISIAGIIYDCSGNFVLDSIQWHWYSGPGIVLSNWWLYHSCGDYFSEASGSPNAYIGYGSSTYTTYPGDKVNINGYDIDSKFAYGGSYTQNSECL